MMLHVEGAGPGLGEHKSIIKSIIKTKQGLQDAEDSAVLLPALWSSSPPGDTEKLQHYLADNMQIIE